MLARQAVLVETALLQLLAQHKVDLVVFRQRQCGSHAGNSRGVLMYRQWNKWLAGLFYRENTDGVDGVPHPANF
ncbi:hypothetical protein D3C73_1486240 [compost metagenome]